MMQAFKIFLMILAVLISLPASARANSDIRGMIDAGHYDDAILSAVASPTAEGHALAAEALNAKILMGQVDDINDSAQAALELAQRALALDPDHANARLQEALADGFVTRTTGDFKAWRKKLPQKTLAKVTALQSDYPENARACALLGAWHMGVIRKTGEANGRKWFGASLSQGTSLYSRAMALAPDDILIATNYHMSMRAINAQKGEPETRAALNAILQMPARTDVERKTKTQVAKMLHILGDSDAELKLAERFLDGDWN